MADQAKGATTGVQKKVEGATGGILSSIQSFAGGIAAKGQAFVDRIFPPEQRSALLAKLQAFMLANPKLSAFLGMNLLLTGIPLGLFILFTITVALFAIIVGLLLGLLGAVVFILFAVGTALLFVLPTIFFTTACACFLFLWGLGGYYILKWANGDQGSGEAPEGSAIGDKLNSLTGGRLSGFMDSARKERTKGSIEGYSDRNTEPHKNEKKDGVPNGSADKASKQVSDTAHKATKASGIDGAHKTAASTTGTAKGSVSGATGVNVPST